MSTTPERDLDAWAEQFLQETGYPTEDDEDQKRLREEWADKLKPENIAALSREEVSAVLNQGIWGAADYVKPMSAPTDAVSNMESTEYDQLLHTIEYLCWGQGKLAERFSAVDDIDTTFLQPTQSGHKKLPGSYVSKLLAICHPDKFLPIGGQDSTAGRVKMLKLLDLPSPIGKNFAYKSVNANDTLRDCLEPHFRDDLYGMARFLYWLLKQESPPPLPSDRPPDEPHMTALAEQLLVGVDLLNDIVNLLKDKGKGQVILYGPPGTGKTYLALKLAEVLAPDESRRALVQFHPSTSYEDFFEGYRPVGNAVDGSIRYELTPGPLARMAERASKPPGKRHIMVIDEINRGNLPRVLGELLFLLEYRDQSIHPLYRPEEQFSLPANLWFIGTMNTADRSIALVDAALRRRFHFVPFFPDSGPIKGLLGRWLTRENQPRWVGELVDAVNTELKGDLEGSHLLLGPSYFMKKDYGSTPDEQRERLRRIWTYNIEPFIEDQFFGDPNRIQHFRFDAVMARHGSSIEPHDAGGPDVGDVGATPAAGSDGPSPGDDTDADDE